MGIRVLLIRHGQTDWNIEGRWQGMEDVPLNAVGFAQAQALAEHLVQRPIRAIFSSDLQRAAETARLVGERLNLRPRLDPRLRELNIGALQGLTYAEMSEHHPTAVRQMRDDYMGFVFPEGESRRMLQDRAHAFWQEMTASEPGPEVAIITHGGWIRILLLRLFPEEMSAGGHAFGNTSITFIDQEADGWRLSQIGSIAHLTEEGRINSDSL
ncbi:MAG: histidine phosphatase family protein [Anaerolineae bacterium]|nr:histidine phosphatase family protein [Anaerolineae bacterium]